MSNKPDGMLAYAEAISNPSRDDPNWPLPSFDARDWSEAFCKIAAEQGLTIDQEWMTGWFANALMRGYDEAQMRVGKSGMLAVCRAVAEHFADTDAPLGIAARDAIAKATLE